MLNAQLNTIRSHRTAKQLNEYKKEWDAQNYQKKRAKINERIFCKICGKTYTRQNKAWHNRSNHHQKFVQFNQSKNETNRKYEKCVQFNNTI